jgi:hypothetical protein
VQLLYRKDYLQGSEIPAIRSARADHSNKPGTDGDRPTRTDGDSQPAPARGTTITL